MKYEDKKNLCKMIQAYYEYEVVGGALHIVLDDGNLEDKHIHWCISAPIKERNDKAALDIANELLKMSFSARNRLYNKEWNI